ncbi:lipopolysaccharide biosynthesis protein [Chelativorans sp. M5D2P16]|uniref:lipopolysaccharide biosynthesis protein n=1 Tax=Chelativorans sp. M5D2P16 TaxID=3095678 RepID=UPI002ACA7CF6|nr:lipopolysaccharide biosynthesis protein [Chelativorans sp. M5D2P16]MDZ5696163.1 lipopolysaccharide biosynthesis protein [Chelativorans sp. M5D2P16]
MLDRSDKSLEQEEEVVHGRLRSGRARAAVHGVFWSALSGFAPAAVAAGVFTVTSRFLTPAEFGLVALAASIAMFASAVAPAGFGQALIQRTDLGRRHLDSVFWLCVAAALIIYAVIVLTAPVFAYFMGEAGLAALLPVIGLRVVFDLAVVVPNALLSRAMAFSKMAMRTMIASLVSAAVCLGLLALGYGLWALALSQLAASVAICVGTLLSVNWRPGLRFEWRALRELAHYGMFASGHRVFRMISLDQILIGSLLGTTALGIYSFSRRIFNILNDLVAGALNSVSYSLLSSLQSEHEKLKEAFLFATFASSALSFPVFVGLAIVAGDLIPILFGAHWIEAIPALRSFCVIGLMSCIGILQASLINSQGNANWWFYYMVAKQVMTVLVVVIFHRFGVSTLVFAIAVQTFLMWPAAVWMVLRILKIGPWTYLRPFFSPAFASLAMFVGVFTLRQYIAEESAYLRLAGEVLSGAIIYCAVLTALDGRRIFQMRNLVLKRRAISA